jgi:2'-5' RNA ligase
MAIAEVGDKVDQGDILATIDDSRLALQRQEARSKVEALSKKIAFLKKEVDRAERLARSRQLARELRGEGFRLELDRLGCFERARVLWLGPSRQPQALAMLQANLGERLAEVGYRAGFDRYRPHVTLARKLRSLPGGLTLPDGALPVAWPVDAFVLIESVDTPAGVDYRVLERYPL